MNKAFWMGVIATIGAVIFTVLVTWKIGMIEDTFGKVMSIVAAVVFDVFCGGYTFITHLIAREEIQSAKTK